MQDINRVFLDANVIIYFIEKNPIYFHMIESFFLSCYMQNIEICCSELCIGESLIGNYKNNLGREKQFKHYFQNPDIISLYPIQQEYLYEAAKLGARNINLFDALHIITAYENQGDIFLTNDKKIKSEHIKILQLSEL